MGKYDGLERDANAAVKALLFEVEEASSLPPDQALHPYVLEERRKRIVRRVWGLVKRAMAMMEADRGDTG